MTISDYWGRGSDKYQFVRSRQKQHYITINKIMWGRPIEGMKEMWRLPIEGMKEMWEHPIEGMKEMWRLPIQGMKEMWRLPIEEMKESAPSHFPKFGLLP